MAKGAKLELKKSILEIENELNEELLKTENEFNEMNKKRAELSSRLNILKSRKKKMMREQEAASKVLNGLPRWKREEHCKFLLNKYQERGNFVDLYGFEIDLESAKEDMALISTMISVVTGEVIDDILKYLDNNSKRGKKFGQIAFKRLYRRMENPKLKEQFKNHRIN